MKNVIDNFLDVIVDTYGSKKKKFTYKDLVNLAYKFSKNDNKLNKRGRPKKEENSLPKKCCWEVIMHYYSNLPTKYYKIGIKNQNLQIHNGIIGLENNISIIDLKNNNSEDFIREKINELKKKNYEIMFKNDKIIL